MEPTKVYEYLVLSRGMVFDRVRTLNAEQYAQRFPIGLGTIGRTLTHIMGAEWFYILRLLEREVPPYSQWPIRDENPPAFDVLESAWKEQTEATRSAIAAVRDWDRTIEYRSLSSGDEAAAERPVVVTATASDIFTQLALHEVHHRAQAMNMLSQLGASVGEIDYNTLMYRRREAD